MVTSEILSAVHYNWGFVLFMRLSKTVLLQSRDTCGIIAPRINFYDSYISLSKYNMSSKKKMNSFWLDGRMPFAELRLSENSPMQFKPHSHREFCVGGAITGDISFEIEDGIFDLSPGGLVLLNPGQVHSCNPVKDQPRSYMMLYLECDWCRSIQASLFGELPALVPVKNNLIWNDGLYRDFVQMSEILLDGNDILEKSEILTDFVTELFRKCCDTPLVKPSPFESSLLEEVASHLTQNYSQSITLEELAGSFSLNQFHLLRRFKECFGLPPHAYQLNARIEEAKRLLRQGSTIAEVAHLTGFADQSHFHRTFRKTVAATPREYQRRVK